MPSSLTKSQGVEVNPTITSFTFDVFILDDFESSCELFRPGVGNEVLYVYSKHFRYFNNID